MINPNPPDGHTHEFLYLGKSQRQTGGDIKYGVIYACRLCCDYYAQVLTRAQWDLLP